MNQPKIRVSGGSSVRIDPVVSIDDLAILTKKFAKIVKANDGGTVCKLMTAVGDLANSIQFKQDSQEEFADEVADVLIATFVAAIGGELNGQDICDALQRRLQEQTSKAVVASIVQVLNGQGLDTEEAGTL